MSRKKHDPDSYEEGYSQGFHDCAEDMRNLVRLTGLYVGALLEGLEDEINRSLDKTAFKKEEEAMLESAIRKLRTRPQTITSKTKTYKKV